MLFIYSFLSNASYNVGTPVRTFGLYLVSNLSNLLASNCGTKIQVTPIQSGPYNPTTKPKQWNNGKIDNNVSPGDNAVKHIFACKLILVKHLLGRTILFGTPVVPPL